MLVVTDDFAMAIPPAIIRLPFTMQDSYANSCTSYVDGIYHVPDSERLSFVEQLESTGLFEDNMQMVHKFVEEYLYYCVGLSSELERVMMTRKILRHFDTDSFHSLKARLSVCCISDLSLEIIDDFDVDSAKAKTLTFFKLKGLNDNHASYLCDYLWADY
jgi:hypothetical protein